MKKGRPGTLVTVLCRQQDAEQMAALIFKYTSTIGIRTNPVSRYVLERRTEVLETPYGSVRNKVSSGYGVYREKYEYEDLARIARNEGISIAEARRAVSDYRKDSADLK